MNFDQLQLTKDQYEKRRLYHKYLRKLKRVKQLIINDRCRQIIKNKELTTMIDIEFKY
jgi:NurA-like 5'-3' nuclease